MTDAELDALVLKLREMSIMAVYNAVYFLTKEAAAAIASLREERDDARKIRDEHFREIERARGIIAELRERAEKAERERDGAIKWAEELELKRGTEDAFRRVYGCLWRDNGSISPMLQHARKICMAYLTKEERARGIRYANEMFGHTTEHEILSMSEHPAPSALPEGWVAVPKEPTREMLMAAFQLDLSYMPGHESADREAIYKAMLSALPTEKATTK